MNKNFFLCVRKLSVCYGKKPVIYEVTFGITRNQIVAFVGPNGAGKTTILKAIGGLIRPVKGEIIFDGQNIEKLPVEEIVKLGIVYVPEGMNVFPHMSVEENLEIGAYVNRNNLAQKLKEVYEIFPELEAKRRINAGSLSGGEQRMVTVARGLMAESKIILLDDPFLGLSPKVTQRFCEAFQTIKKQGVTLLVAGQHVRRLLTAAGWSFLIEDGHISLSGSGANMLQNPHLQRVLFGNVPLVIPGIGKPLD